MNYINYLLCILLIPCVIGQSLICQNGSTLSEDHICECEDDLIYNAYEGQCQDICSFYGDNICGYNSNAACESDLVISTNVVCNCKDGFTKSNQSSAYLTCIDNVKKCNANSCVEENTVCVNLVGSYKCVCDEYYYRNASGCVDLDKCKIPGGYLCEQNCINDPKNVSNPKGYKCDCYPGFHLEGEPGKCIADDPNQNCTCNPNPTWATCAITEGTPPSCEPNMGFEKDVDGKIIDINECNEGQQCPENSKCSNQIGKYTCDCISGYTWNYTLRECIRATCPPGYFFNENECQELCSPELGNHCPYETICLVDYNNVKFCDCQLICQMNGNRNKTLALYAYSLNFIAPYYTFEDVIKPNDLYRLTRSFESIFGRGNVQLINYTNELSGGTAMQMAIGLDTALSKGNVNQVADIVKYLCWPIITFTSQFKCVLPDDIIVAIDSISAEILYPCKVFQSLCSSLSANCSDQSDDSSIKAGNYECKCARGFERVDELEELYCADIDECSTVKDPCPKEFICLNSPGSYSCVTNNSSLSELNKQLEETQTKLDDQEQKTKVVGGVLGAFLALFFILFIIAIGYIFKIKS